MRRILFFLFILLSVFSVQAQRTAEDYNKRGLERFYANDRNGAIDDLTKAIEIDPTFADAYINRGYIVGVLGGDDQQKLAIADYTKAIELKPTDADIYLKRSFLRRQIKDFDGAIADCTKAIEINPTPNNYRFRALAQEAKPDFAKAIADLMRAIEIDPKYVEAYRERAYINLFLKDYDKAIVDYTKVLQLTPKDYFAPNLLSQIYIKKKDYSSAIDVCTRAIAEGFLQYYEIRGEVRIEMGDNEAAIADFTKAIEASYSQVFPHAYWARAKVYRKLGKITEAEADEKKAKEIRSQSL